MSKDAAFTFRVPADLLERFRAYAVDQGVPVSALLRDYMLAAADNKASEQYVLVRHKPAENPPFSLPQQS